MNFFAKLNRAHLTDLLDSSSGTAAVLAWGCVSAHGMANLHICEGSCWKAHFGTFTSLNIKYIAIILFCLNVSKKDISHSLITFCFIYILQNITCFWNWVCSWTVPILSGGVVKSWTKMVKWSLHYRKSELRELLELCDRSSVTIATYLIWHHCLSYMGGVLVLEISSSFSLINSRSLGYSSKRSARPEPQKKAKS